MFKAVKKTTIEGTEYQLNLLRADVGFRTALKLAGIAGPLISEVTGGNEDEGFDIGLIVGDLFAEGGDELFEIINVILEGLMANGKTVDFGDHFMGNYAELVAVTVWALKENFSSFFTGNALSSLTALLKV